MSYLTGENIKEKVDCVSSWNFAKVSFCNFNSISDLYESSRKITLDDAFF